MFSTNCQLRRKGLVTAEMKCPCVLMLIRECFALLALYIAMKILMRQAVL